jgi:hypothetical protein
MSRKGKWKEGDHGMKECDRHLLTCECYGQTLMEIENRYMAYIYIRDQPNVPFPISMAIASSTASP